MGDPLFPAFKLEDNRFVLKKKKRKRKRGRHNVKRRSRKKKKKKGKRKRGRHNVKPRSLRADANAKRRVGMGQCPMFMVPQCKDGEVYGKKQWGNIPNCYQTICVKPRSLRSMGDPLFPAFKLEDNHFVLKKKKRKRKRKRKRGRHNVKPRSRKKKKKRGGKNGKPLFQKKKKKKKKK